MPLIRFTSASKWFTRPTCIDVTCATVMDGSIVEEDSMIAAGALVTPGSKFPARSLILGSPARAKRVLTDEEVIFIAQSARNYLAYAREHRG